MIALEYTSKNTSILSKIQNISLFLNKPSGSPPKNILSNWKNWITQNSFTFCMGLRNKKHHHASAQISFWTIRQPFWILTRKFRVKKRLTFGILGVQTKAVKTSTYTHQPLRFLRGVRPPVSCCATCRRARAESGLG